MKNKAFDIALVNFMVEHKITSWAELYFQLLLRKHGTVSAAVIAEDWTHDMVIDLAEELIQPEPPIPVPETPEPQLLEHHNL